MGAIKLYELAGAEPDRRFSPFCWRTRMALAHKGLTTEGIAWRFLDKDAIAASGQGLVPVLMIDDQVLSDSWKIAEFLESRYGDRPSLFGGEAGQALCRFINHWTNTQVNPALFRMIGIDIYRHLAPSDQSYFRQTREARFGTSLENLAADRDERVKSFRQLLQPMRACLDSAPYLGGERPLYADYILFGSFQWARCISEFRLLEPDDPVHAWRQRLLGAFDGLAGRAKGYPV